MLQDSYRGVEFVRSHAPKTERNPKALPALTEMLQVGRDLPEGAVFAITNSDVEFKGDHVVLAELFNAARGGAIYSNRFEQAPLSMEAGLPYLYGYDLFIFDNRFVCPDDLLGFQIGAPWWDYLLIYLAAARDIPLSVITCPVITHSTHDQAWSVESWSLGLGEVAKILRRLAAEEGPAAALLAYMCRNFEPGVAPSFLAEQIHQKLGTVLGTAMVSYVNERSSEILWFDLVDEGRGHHPRGAVKRARNIPPLQLVGG